MNLSMKRRKVHTAVAVVALLVLLSLASCCTRCEAKRSRGSSRSSSRGSTSIFQRNSNRKGSSKEPSIQHPAQDTIVAPNGKGAVLSKPRTSSDTAKKVETKPLHQPQPPSAPQQPAAPPPYQGAPPAYNPGAPPAYNPGQQPVGWNVPNTGSNQQLHSQKTVGQTQSGYPQQPHGGAPPAYSPGAYPPAYSPQGMPGGYPQQNPYGHGMAPQGGYPQQSPYGHGMAPQGGYPQQNPYGHGMAPQGGYHHGGGYNNMQSGGYGGHGGYGGYGGGFGGGYGALPYQRKQGFGSGFGGTMVKVVAGMLIWNMVSSALMPSRRYQVHNYYNSPETVPQEISLPANVIMLCEDGSKDLCISGTIPLCTQNGTIMCVTTMTNTVPCTDNTGNCISTTDTATGSNQTAPQSGATNLPCIANATVSNLEGLDLNKQKTSTTVNATISLFDGVNTQTIFCVTTLAVPTPDELPGENVTCSQGAENTTACNQMLQPPPMGPYPGYPNQMMNQPLGPQPMGPPPMGYQPMGPPLTGSQPIGPPPTGSLPMGPSFTNVEGQGPIVNPVEDDGTKTPPLDELDDSAENIPVMDQPIGPIERVPMNIPVIPRDIPKPEIHGQVEDINKVTPAPLSEVD